ncbi:MAG: flagellar hook-basal body complex protein, partial [Geopsychrobacter sp.]|nr:flagellar hook-basal body complex protein [Geopsychrobacter sp.]
MGISSSLFSGVSGLNANGNAMSVIGNNIANANTIGFKASRTIFGDLLSSSISGSGGSSQVGRGVGLSVVDNIFSQGTFENTELNTDLAVEGPGFFIVSDPSTGNVTNNYTRAGSFIQDDQGFLKNSQGYYIQGWPTDAGGKVVPANSSLTVTNQNIISSDYLSSINLNRVGGTAAATTNVAIGANLPLDPAGSTHKTDVEFFDSLGNANNLSLVYTKTTTGNQW